MGPDVYFFRGELPFRKFVWSAEDFEILVASINLMIGLIVL